MIRPQALPPHTEYPLGIVGSNTFGRNPKMSSRQVFNLMIPDITQEDQWLVQTPGYKRTLTFNAGNNGRVAYSSFRGDFMIVVISNSVFRVSGPQNALVAQKIFELETFFGDVFVAENILDQIAVVDGQDFWVYNWRTNAIPTKAVLPINSQTGLPIKPGYVTYHDGYFIVPDTTSAFWYLSQLNDGLVWDWGAGATYVAGSIQTKPTNAKAVLRAPGKGNLIYVFGADVVELWQNVGSQLFPYQRTSSVSIDYGCASPNTIAAMDEYIAFLGVNEKAGPAILVSAGGQFQRLSTDGIDFKLGELVNPELSYAFFYRIDGHVFYQITFYGPRDNYTLIYDFNTKKFFYLTDENMNFHIAESIAFFNNTYYFVSLVDGDLYEMSSKYTTYDYGLPGVTGQDKIIPRVTICNAMEQTDGSMFIANSATFEMEQGVDPFYPSSPLRFITTPGGKVLETTVLTGYQGKFLSTSRTLPDYIPAVDLSISKDSGQTFGSYYRKNLNAQGNRKNRVIFWGLGIANDLVLQFRFWSKARVTISNGVLSARVQEGGQ